LCALKGGGRERREGEREKVKEKEKEKEREREIKRVGVGVAGRRFVFRLVYFVCVDRVALWRTE